MRFFIDTSGRWSGGGQAFLANAAHAVERHEILTDRPEGAVPLVPRNVPAARGELRRPYVLAPQNAWPWVPRVKGLAEAKLVGQLRLASEFYLRRADAVMRISSMIPPGGRPASPVIHNVLDSGFEQALEDSATVGGGGVDLARGRIVSIGSGHSYRNLPFLLAAYGRYREAGGTRGLLIAGPAGNHRVKRDVEQARAGLPDVVVVWSSFSRAECLAMFREAALVVLPACVEASPFSALEAATMNPHVALSAIPGNREILAQSVPGFDGLGSAGFSPDDVEGASRALAAAEVAPLLEREHVALRSVQLREQARESWGQRLAGWLTDVAGQLDTVQNEAGGNHA